MKYKFYVMMNNNNDNNTSPYINRNKHNNRPPSSSCIYIDCNYNDYFLFFFLLKEIEKTMIAFF